MSSLKDKVYIMGCGIVQNGRHLELYPKLEIIPPKKTEEIENFLCWT